MPSWLTIEQEVALAAGRLIRRLHTIVSVMFVFALIFLASSLTIAQDNVEPQLALLDRQQEINRALYVAAATTVTLQRQSDRQLRSQRFELDELQIEVDELHRKVAAGEAGRAKLITLSEHYQIGVVQVAQGKNLEALAHWERALEITERLLIIDPGNASWVNDNAVITREIENLEVDVQ